MAVLLFAGPAWSHSDGRRAGHTQSLDVSVTQRAPTIDGSLDEEEWLTARVASDFWVIDQKRWASDPTEVMVLADDDCLYFAFRVHDAEPSAIEALHMRRDTELGFDDQVVIELDPFHNHRLISRYAVNARGTQSDSIAGGRARKVEWKGDWRAAVARTAYGWSAEVAIPFSILNYDASTRVIGANFARYQHRTREWSRWADLTPAHDADEMGHLTGIELPQAAQRWLLMPYGLVGHNMPDKQERVRTTLATAGVDVRYAPRQNLTAVLSLNPDFSQIERKLTDIDFSYTEKYREDVRPFFAEGSAYFDPEGTYFYSSRIPGFDAGLKGFTHFGSLEFGGLVTSAPGGRRDSVLRLNREFGAVYSASVMAVTTQRPDLQNELIVSKVTGRHTNNLTYSLEGAASRTDGRVGDGHTLQASLGWQSDHWTFGTLWDRYSKDFLPANGLLREDRPGTRGIRNVASYYRESGTRGPIVTGELVFSKRDTEDGREQQRNWYGGGSIELRRTKLGLFYDQGTYRPPGAQRGDWADAMNDDHYWMASVDFNPRSERVNVGTTISSGSLGGGEYRYVGSYLWLKPTRRTSVQLTDERLRSFGKFKQRVVWLAWDVTAVDRVAARFLSTSHGAGLRMSYTHNVRKGVDVFLLGDRDVHQDAQVSIKVLLSVP